MDELDVVVVGGAGHVGLPFANMLASRGLKVSAYDIDVLAVESINMGNVPFEEPNLSEMMAENLRLQKFSASYNPEVISSAKIIVIVFGTPVDEFLAANPNVVLNQIRNLLPFLKSGQQLILRSTLYPNLSRRIEQLLLDSGLEIGVTYCPERIAEGKAILEIASLPQIIGTSSLKIPPTVSHIFSLLGVETIQMTFEEAELAKLFSNAWRYITFATANSFFMISESAGANYETIRQAMMYKYPRANGIPSSGFAAGPCLPKDTMQLQTYMNGNFLLGSAAFEVNENLPNYLISRLKQEFDLTKLHIAILGTSFKGNIDDSRSSLAYKLRKLLEFEAKLVTCVEPYASDYTPTSLEDALNSADIFVIGAPHDQFRNLNTRKPIVDIWNLDKSGILIKKPRE